MFDPIKATEALLDINLALIYRRIPFFLIQGTALGAYRDHGFTPTEKDIDLGILAEYFIPHAKQIERDLQQIGFETSRRSKPFDKTRVIVARRGDVKVDLTSYVLWKEQRFCANTDPALSYSVVYDRMMIESYDFLKVFGKTFRTPHPIEKYLELEYGPEWRTPADDSFSRTRVYGYVEKEGIPHDYLDSFQNDHSPNAFG